MQGKVILVTGGARRVGAATCRRLHAQGANLLVHYRASEREARALQTELNQVRPGSVALAQADLLDIARLPDLIDETIRHFGKLDALVNNASSFFPTPLGEITENMWDDLIGSNLKAPLFLSQAAAPQLRNSRLHRQHRGYSRRMAAERIRGIQRCKRRPGVAYPIAGSGACAGSPGKRSFSRPHSVA